MNPSLIPSQGSGSPGEYHYSYLDNGWLAPDTTYYYWLEDVSTTGVATRHEPVSVLYTGSPTAVSLSRFGAAPVLPARPIAALLMTALAAGAAAARRRVTSNNE